MLTFHTAYDNPMNQLCEATDDEIWTVLVAKFGQHVTIAYRVWQMKKREYDEGHKHSIGAGQRLQEMLDQSETAVFEAANNPNIFTDIEHTIAKFRQENREIKITLMNFPDLAREFFESLKGDFQKEFDKYCRHSRLENLEEGSFEYHKAAMGLYFTWMLLRNVHRWEFVRKCGHFPTEYQTNEILKALHDSETVYVDKFKPEELKLPPC
jgi:hypothetical protein